MGKNLYVLFFTIRDIDNMISWKHLKKKNQKNSLTFLGTYMSPLSPELRLEALCNHSFNSELL